MTYTEVYKMIKSAGLFDSEGDEALKRSQEPFEIDKGYENKQINDAQNEVGQVDRKTDPGDKSARIGSYASLWQPGGYLSTIKDQHDKEMANREKGSGNTAKVNDLKRGLVMPVIKKPFFSFQTSLVPQKTIFESRKTQAAKAAPLFATQGTNAQARVIQYLLERGRINQQFYNEMNRPATDTEAYQLLSEHLKKFYDSLDPVKAQKLNIQGGLMVRNSRPRIPAMPSVADTSYSAIG